MAISPTDEYPLQTNTSDLTGYPFGKGQDITVPGDGLGTPWQQKVVNDIFGLQQALLSAAGLTPSGTPDKVGASQYLDAIKKIRNKEISRNAARSWLGSSEVIVPPGSGGSPDAEFLVGNEEWWVAVGNQIGGLSSPTLAYATHGSTAWKFNTSLGDAVNLHGASWDPVNNLFIAVGGISGAYIMTAPDPSGTLTSQTPNATATLRCVHTNTSGISVAAGDHDSTNMAATGSTNGVDWFAVETIAGSAGDVVSAMASNGAVFVAVGSTSAGVPLIWLSTDSGSNFSVVTIPGGFTDKPVGITWDGLRFIVLGDDGKVITSLTGATASWAVISTLTIATGTGVSIEADPVNGVTVVLAEDEFHLSDDQGATWARVPHVPANSTTPAVPEWHRLGFDGSAWGAVKISLSPREIFGSQTVSVPAA